jgi:hypothetical protein
MQRRFATKDLNRNLTLLGILFLFHSLPGAAHPMVDSAARFDEIPSAQSRFRRAIDDSWIYSLSSPALVDSGTLESRLHHSRRLRQWCKVASRSFTCNPKSPHRPIPGSTGGSPPRESLLFTGVMHAFNLTTEAGTRDALNGPWFNDYLRSVSELRGWSDSDRFMVP